MVSPLSASYPTSLQLRNEPRHASRCGGSLCSLHSLITVLLWKHCTVSMAITDHPLSGLAFSRKFIQPVFYIYLGPGLLFFNRQRRFLQLKSNKCLLAYFEKTWLLKQWTNGPVLTSPLLLSPLVRVCSFQNAKHSLLPWTLLSQARMSMCLCPSISACGLMATLGHL